ncbi:hypothetical protein KJ785_03175 [Patescibacteria group bacterium]|nr:hypothetical protein [Patescibacteria group bacterium]
MWYRKNHYKNFFQIFGFRPGWSPKRKKRVLEKLQELAYRADVLCGKEEDLRKRCKNLDYVDQMTWFDAKKKVDEILNLYWYARHLAANMGILPLIRLGNGFHRPRICDDFPEGQEPLSEGFKKASY